MTEVTNGTDARLKIYVTSALKHLVGGKRREQIVQWMADRKWAMSYNSSPLTEIDWRTADHNALGREIYNLWCLASHHKPVDGQANVDAVMKRLGQKFGYSDAEAMDQHEADIAHHLRELLKSYIWRDDYLRCQVLDDKDLNYAANTFWIREVTPGLKDEDHAAIERRRREGSPIREYEDDELRSLLLQWLRTNWRCGFTYGAAAKEFRCDWKQASRLLHSMAQRGPDVVMYHGSWLDKKGDKQKKKLFKYCPQRKLMDADYTRAREIMSEALLSYIAAHPDETKRAIRVAMREYFGYISDHVVDDALGGLLADEKVCFKEGKHGAHLHFIPPDQAQP